MTVSNTDLRIDSLDVEEDILALKEELAAEFNKHRREDIQEELEALEDFAEQGRGYDDWEYGAALIHEDDFAEYAEELVTELGYLDKVPGWIKYHIDWDAVSDELKDDYTGIVFGGVTYYIR